MADLTRLRTGAKVLVDQLLIHGTRHIFCVPGESYLAVLDALVDTPVELTVCRQEGGAAMMADAHGKLTGRPGICFVTRGPGATNASPGLHIARQDSTPVILFVGQVQRSVKDREALQEIDYRSAFGSIAKWVTEIDRADRIPELVSRAFSVAISGRPGPVVVVLPEDMLEDTTSVQDSLPAVEVETYPGAEQLRALQSLFETAKRPIAVVGGSRWTEASVRGFARFAERMELPVAVSLRRQMLFPADHRCFIGDLGFGPNPALVTRIKDADLLLVVGGRLSEVPSQGYTLVNIPVPSATFVHVHPDPNELGKVYRPHLAINASPVAFSASLTGLAIPETITWSKHLNESRDDYLRWSDPKRVETPGSLKMERVMEYLRERLPPETVLCNGAGNYATWVHRFYRFRSFGSQLAPTSGSMGYGVPAGVAAKRIFPGRPVVVFAGDGCFLMNGQEFATAVQYELPLVVIVVDNSMYGTIRMHQERRYPGRVSATNLKNPDFAAYARAFGGHGERVCTTEEFPPALERALASRKPSIIHCLLDPDAISPSVTLSEIRRQALSTKSSSSGAPENDSFNIRCIVGASGRVQARHCGAPANR